MSILRKRSRLSTCFTEETTLKHVPVIFLTAIVAPGEVAATGSVIGRHTFLAKPIKIDALTTCIEDHLK